MIVEIRQSIKSFFTKFALKLVFSSLFMDYVLMPSKIKVRNELLLTCLVFTLVIGVLSMH